MARRSDSTGNRPATQATGFVRIGRAPEADALAVLQMHADLHGPASVCRVVFNLNEFVFVD